MPSKTTDRSRHSLLAITLATALLGAAAALPTAAAHTCTAELGDANEQDCRGSCKGDDDHDHKVTHHHENGLGQDVNHVHFECSSRGDGGGRDCVTPRILGLCPIEQKLNGELSLH